MREDIASILLSEEQLHTRVRELGEEISRDYAGKEPLFVGVLKGCFIFMADLFREVTIPGGVDFMAVSSYGNGTSTTGAVKINKDLSQDIENRDVIIVEDILDSGITLKYLIKNLSSRQPASIEVATFLWKDIEGKQAAVNPKYVCTHCPDDFVVGYGLDYAQRYRNLPYVGVLKPEVYS